jgi:hypothetical protein
MAIEKISGKAPIKLKNRLNVLYPLFMLVLFAVFFHVVRQKMLLPNPTKSTTSFLRVNH